MIDGRPDLEDRVAVLVSLKDAPGQRYARTPAWGLVRTGSTRVLPFSHRPLYPGLRGMA